MIRIGAWIALSLVACGGDPPSATDMPATSSGDVMSSTSAAAPTTASGPAATSEGTGPATSEPAPDPRCGDGILDDGEACDDGQNGDNDDGCTDRCGLPRCGDRFTQPSLGEECDHGEDNSDELACTSTCKQAVCGDGLVNTHDYEEQCDDGNQVNDDGCSNACANFCCSEMLLVAGAHWWSFASKFWNVPPGAHPQYVGPGLAVAKDGRGLAVYAVQGILQAVLFRDGIWDWRVPPEIMMGDEIPTVSVHADGFHIVYEGADEQAYYAGFDGETWDPLAEPVGVGGLDLGTVVTLDGDATYVYVDPQTGALLLKSRAPTWQPPQQIHPTSQGTRPEVAVLTAGPELMVVEGDRSFTRTLGMWSPPVTFTDAGVQPGSASLAALPDGGAAVAWRDPDDDVLVALHDMNTDTWSLPEQVGATTGTARLAAGLGPATLELVVGYSKTLHHYRHIDGAWQHEGFEMLGFSGGFLTLARAAL